MIYVAFAGFSDLIQRLSGTVVLFGTGKRARTLAKRLLSENGSVTGLYAVSRKVPKEGVFQAGDRELPVLAPSALSLEKTCASLTILLTDERNLKEDYMTLLQLGLPDSVSFSIAIAEYLSPAVSGKGCSQLPSFPGHRIPRIIHTFWFSGEEKPPLYRRCLHSWKRVMPDVEIREWNLENTDLSKSAFAISAAKAQKWAFVSDYARLDVLCQYGGIYLDMDVLMLRPFDNLLNVQGFFAFDVNGRIDPGSGFGAEAGHPLLRNLLKRYEGHTYTEDAAFMQPDFLAPAFERFGLQNDGTFQIIDQTVFYPRSYFSPLDSVAHLPYGDLSQTFSCHLYESGWLSEKQRKRRALRRKEYQSIIRLIGREKYHQAILKAIFASQSNSEA